MDRMQVDYLIDKLVTWKWDKHDRCPLTKDEADEIAYILQMYRAQKYLNQMQKERFTR